jgi:hypothetical protein
MLPVFVSTNAMLSRGQPYLAKRASGSFITYNNGETAEASIIECVFAIPLPGIRMTFILAPRRLTETIRAPRRGSTP